MTIRTSALLLTLATLFSACAYEDESTEFRTSSPGTGGGIGTGIVFNTNVVDDDALSELLQPLATENQGVMLKGVTLAGGQVVHHFEVVDGDVVAHTIDKEEFAGPQLVDSTWRVARVGVTENTYVHLVERVLIDGWPHYRFNETGDTYSGSTCVTSSGLGYARLLPGFTLDEASGQIDPLVHNTYVACTHGATGKAATWGYYDLALDLGDFEPFEVAIRAIRADYCYTGEPHSQTGTPLLIEDVWGVNNEGFDDPEATLEAVWGETGLLCGGQGRITAIPAECGKRTIPACPPGTTIDTYPDALFVTRLP
jgi:hypothetical protein